MSFITNITKLKNIFLVKLIHCYLCSSKNVSTIYPKWAFRKASTAYEEGTSKYDQHRTLWVQSSLAQDTYIMTTHNAGENKKYNKSMQQVFMVSAGQNISFIWRNGFPSDGHTISSEASHGQSHKVTCTCMWWHVLRLCQKHEYHQGQTANADDTHALW